MICFLKNDCEDNFIIVLLKKCCVFMFVFLYFNNFNVNINVNIDK